MRKVKVRKIGNSLGIILPAEVLERMRVQEGAELYMTEEGSDLRLLSPATELKDVGEAFEEFRLQYRNTLKKLAE